MLEEGRKHQVGREPTECPSLCLPPEIDVAVVGQRSTHVSIGDDLDHILVGELFDLMRRIYGEALFAKA